MLAASEQLKELNEKLEVQKVAVTEKSEACEKLLVEINQATTQANEKKELAIAKKEEIAEQNKQIVEEKGEAEEALAAALPALEEAKLALQDLNKSDVTEIRSVQFFVQDIFHSSHVFYIFPQCSGWVTQDENSIYQFHVFETFFSCVTLKSHNPASSVC